MSLRTRDPSHDGDRPEAESWKRLLSLDEALAMRWTGFDAFDGLDEMTFSELEMLENGITA